MLEIKDLTKDFGDVRAVDHLALHADKGETVVIMGPSGCGKSTTIRMINRLVEPDFGTVFFDGIDITGLHKNELLAMRKRIGYVFQHFNLIARLTALENVMLGLVMGRVSYDEAKKRAVAILEKVGLGRYMNYKPRELSGGH